MTQVMGRMMQMPLMISSLLRHAARHAGDIEIVSRRVEGDVHRSDWATLERRARQCAQALAALGTQAGDRVATLAWNGYRHLEIYYASSGSQRICHTINPRLFPEQITWIANDAQDQVLCLDLSFLALVEQLAPQLATVRHYVLLCERERMPAHSTLPGLLCYEDLLAAQDGDYSWPDFDENTASSLCYTSGTTGNPKGALYSHRSTLLHAWGSAMPDSLNLSARDVVMPVVPMFHVNAWSIPYVAAMVGCKLVLPGPHLDGASLHALMEAEQVTFSGGVPTVWLGLLAHMKAQGLTFSTFRRTAIGGSACPPAMIRSFKEDFGVEVLHAWGMTEMSPLGTVATLRHRHATLAQSERDSLLATQGRVMFGVDMAIVDDAGRSQPWDGESTGDLVVRGPWVIARYHGAPASPLVSVDGQAGWFPTGDVASIDPEGYMRITDRSKDVIKSGGEWISSIELENIAMSHPGVHEAAVIACPHPKWDERPLLVVVLRAGTDVSREELLAHFDGRIARWQIPDDVVFLSEIPHTATGKVQKLRLREMLSGHRLPGV